MKIAVKPLSASGFGLALLCFFMPWVSVSCPGQESRLVSLTGAQLVTGTSVEQPSIFGNPTRRIVPGEPLAIGALACGLVGLALALAKGREARAAGAVVGAAGAVVLLVLKYKVDGDLARQAQGALQARWEAGYWIALVALVAAVFANVVIRQSLGPPRRDSA